MQNNYINKQQRDIEAAWPSDLKSTPKEETEVVLSPKVMAFAEAMQHELNANAKKGDWQTFTDVIGILNELEYHKAKLMIDLKKGDKKKVLEHIADCGNFLLMLGNAGGLYDPQIDNKDDIQAWVNLNKQKKITL